MTVNIWSYVGFTTRPEFFRNTNNRIFQQRSFGRDNQRRTLDCQLPLKMCRFGGVYPNEDRPLFLTEFAVMCLRANYFELRQAIRGVRSTGGARRVYRF